MTPLTDANDDTFDNPDDFEDDAQCCVYLAVKARRNISIAIICSFILFITDPSNVHTFYIIRKKLRITM